ncbi:hypothetical protein H4582DRAFT_1140971 [Lactarius indigo]|nr:hypothetical protein H4582DRAFT_1140971 [Lactarius indigo]
MPLENAQIVAPVAGLRRGWYFCASSYLVSFCSYGLLIQPRPERHDQLDAHRPHPLPHHRVLLLRPRRPVRVRALLPARPRSSSPSAPQLRSGLFFPSLTSPLTPARNPLRFELTRTRLRTVQPGPHQLHRNVMQEASPLTQKQSIALPLPHAHNSRWTFPRCSILQLVPHPKPVFYSNRATCYVSMEPSQHEEAVADCDRHSYRR